MKVIDRLRISIGRRSDQIILRSELVDICSPSQLTNALDQLIKEGCLMRVSSGVYAKRNTRSEGLAQSPSGVQAMAAEVFKKLGRSIKSATTLPEGKQDHVVIDGGSHRLSRKFKIGHAIIEYSSPNAKVGLISLTADLDALPRKNVSEFIQRFARSRHVHFKRSGLDAWAEAVTRAAGDEIKLDETGKLLVALKKKQLINGRQMARLMTNHLREHQRV